MSPGTVVVFTEKPGAARAAADALGKLPGQPNSGVILTKKGFFVTHGIGHLMRLQMPEEIDPAMGEWDKIAVLANPIPMTPIEGTRSQLNAVVKLLSKADLVLLAADVGREGELIGYEVFEHARYKGRIQRVLLKSLEPTAVREAFDNPQPAHLTYPWYLEAKARQNHDYWKGLTSTRGASTRLRPKEAGRTVWATGPVKGPALALICEREVAIRRHVPEDYRILWLDAAASGGRSVRLRYPGAGQAVLKDLPLADRILDAAKTASGPISVSDKLERVGPPQPFNIDAFQRKMGQKPYNLPSDRSFKALERLYNDGFVTYPRTPARTWAFAQAASAPYILEKLASVPGLEAAGAAAANPVIRKGSRYASSKEHDALAPTRKIPNLAQLGADERAAYLCVVRNYIANHLPDAEDFKTRVRLDVPVAGREPVAFTATGTVEKNPGWRVAFGGGRGGKEDLADEAPIGKAIMEKEGETRLPMLKDGETVTATDAKAEARKTEPPPRFAEAEIPTVLARLIDVVDDPSLKKALENPDDPSQPKGLGTPATRKDVGPELIALGYVAIDNKVVKPTARGFALYFSHLQDPTLKREMDPVSRAQLEHELGLIGQASSVEEAERRRDAFIVRALADTRTVADAYDRAKPFSEEMVPNDLRDLVSGLGAKSVSQKQMKLVRDIAKQKGIRLSKDMTGNPEAVRLFLDEHAPKREKGEDGKLSDGPPSDKQVAAIQRFADHNKTDQDWNPDTRSPGWRTSARAASVYLDWAIKRVKALQHGGKDQGDERRPPRRDGGSSAPDRGSRRQAPTDARTGRSGSGTVSGSRRNGKAGGAEI